MRRISNDGCQLRIEALKKFETVPEGIFSVETAKAGNLAVLNGRHAGFIQPSPQRFEVISQQGGVAAAGRHLRLDTAVNLLLAAGKPGTTTVAEAGRLGQLGHA